MSPTESPEQPVPLVAVVGDQQRHRWFASRLMADPRLDLRGVVYEQKRARPEGATEAENELIADHFQQRTDAERRYFGEAPEWAELEVPSLGVAFGESNEPSVADWVERAAASHLALFGCSIIRDPLLSAFEDRTINIHLGLSPYYRGSATNFWPLVNGEPECVGATIHLATLKVDAGPMLRQARPAMTADDGSHDIGCKAIIDGTAALTEAIAAYAAGELEPVPQQPGGRLYRNADFTPDSIVEMRRRFAEGMIPAYLADREARDAAFPIVE